MKQDGVVMVVGLGCGVVVVGECREGWHGRARCVGSLRLGVCGVNAGDEIRGYCGECMPFVVANVRRGAAVAFFVVCCNGALKSILAMRMRISALTIRPPRHGKLEWTAGRGVRATRVEHTCST